MAAHQAPLSLGFSRQEHCSGLPFPSPMHESEKWKLICSVVSDSSQPHVVQPTTLLHPWDFSGKSTGVGCHCLLHLDSLVLWKGPCLGHFSVNLAHKRLTVNVWKYKALYLLPRNYSYMPCMGFSYFPWSPGHHLCWISKSIKAVPDGCLEVFNHG